MDVKTSSRGRARAAYRFQTLSLRMDGVVNVGRDDVELVSMSFIVLGAPFYIAGASTLFVQCGRGLAMWSVCFAGLHCFVPPMLVVI